MLRGFRKNLVSTPGFPFRSQKYRYKISYFDIDYLSSMCSLVHLITLREILIMQVNI